MKKESLLPATPKLTMIVSLIVCIGAIVGVLGYFLTKKLAKVETRKIEMPKEVIQDEIADWQTYNTTLSTLDIYKNLDNPFSFKYPVGWKIDETKGGVAIFLEKMNENEKMWIVPSIQCNKIPQLNDQGIWCYQGDSIVDIKELCSKYGGKGGYTYKGYSYKKTCISKNNMDFITVTFPFNNKSSDVFNQILSTFKFIEK